MIIGESALEQQPVLFSEVTQIFGSVERALRHSVIALINYSSHLRILYINGQKSQEIIAS